ncbi:MAG: chromosomal replication initiator protein DnaA [Alphaproteobacteria bacterium]|nr:chromosomal replication initiator protein DnaA [Alphaproteobacteria bacterium]MDD9920619.1 chromosomal replication initiator protein DnaA [Alphaproteobacteria bacterium]
MSLSSAQWSSVQVALKGQVGEEDFNSWLSSLRIASEQTDLERVALSVPTRFIQDWVDEHYGDIIQKSISETLQRDIAVTYVVKPVMEAEVVAPQEKVVEVKGELASTSEDRNKQSVSAAGSSDTDLEVLANSGRLDPRFTFDTFVTGKSNHFAYAAAQRIAESDVTVYNPFFLHGGVGLGKTHLMHAIGSKIKERNPNRHVVYISAEQFLNYFIKALKGRSTLAFKEAFRAADVLMIDDIQFIAGKGTTQEEFFHTFNALVGMGKQVILTADRPPHELDGIEDRLRSRLGAGLTCEIHAPDVETRQAILEKKAEETGLKIPSNVTLFLADGIDSSIRELEGALNRLAAYAQLSDVEITLDFAQEQLKDLLRVQKKQATIEEIQHKVADYFDVRLADLLGTRRLREIARPRQVAMYLSKRLTSKSYPDIGRAFGGRDHTTVMHAVRTIENLLSREPDLAEKVELVEKVLTTHR